MKRSRWRFCWFQNVRRTCNQIGTLQQVSLAEIAWTLSAASKVEKIGGDRYAKGSIHARLGFHGQFHGEYSGNINAESSLCVESSTTALWHLKSPFIIIITCVLRHMHYLLKKNTSNSLDIIDNYLKNKTYSAIEFFVFEGTQHHHRKARLSLSTSVSRQQAAAHISG